MYYATPWRALRPLIKISLHTISFERQHGNKAETKAFSFSPTHFCGFGQGVFTWEHLTMKLPLPPFGLIEPTEASSRQGFKDVMLTR